MPHIRFFARRKIVSHKTLNPIKSFPLRNPNGERKREREIEIVPIINFQIPFD